MTADHRRFYLFLGSHSLLIGLFPFYLPVTLWQQHGSLAWVSGFIAIGGAGFLIGLWAWDRLRQIISLPVLQLGSFAAFVAMMLMVALQHSPPSSAWLMTGVLALCYGVYQSLFWTTQRALFLELVTPANSGRAYGNFQLFVFAALQLGILFGGWMLEYSGFGLLLGLSLLLAVAFAMLLWRSQGEYSADLRETPVISLTDIISFRDRERSRRIFLLDGLFLFFESFFWVISLFLLAHQSFTRLGAIVIVLAICFGALYYLLKNTIDRLGRRNVYVLAVGLYTLSWLLRARVDETFGLLLLFCTLVIITFCSSIFRLVFNKRFYDIANGSSGHRYIILKSYYTQAGLAVAFTMLALLSATVVDAEMLLRWCYIGAALLCPLYLMYGAQHQREG